MNTIVENLLEQVDNDGWDTGILKEIVSFRTDPNVAVVKGENSNCTSLNGIKRPVITTKKWDVQVRWEDQSTRWVPLATIKESNPIEVAEFAMANTYVQESAFQWWVPHVIKTRRRIINRVAVRLKKGNDTKFGFKIPKTVQDALHLDRENGNNLWRNAIEKEMKNSRVAFEILGQDDIPPVGSKKITCHLIFDVKMDLTRKTQEVTSRIHLLQ